MRKLLVLILIFVIAGCKEVKTQFGGSQAYVPPSGDDGTLALQLIASDSLLLQIDRSSAQVSGGKITKIINKITDFATVVGPLDLDPSENDLNGSLSASSIRLPAPVSAGSFESSIDSDLYLQATSIVALLDSDSRGSLVSINPLDRGNQSFSIESTDSKIAAIYSGSPSDTSEASINRPSDNVYLVGASFGSSPENLALTVNGSLNNQPILTGNPPSPFIISRVISLGPLTNGQTAGVRELYVFSRELSLKELGAMVRYLAKKNSLSFTFAPELGSGSLGGPAVDPNFAPAQAIITNNCLSCHASWSGASAKYYVNAGLVTKGSPASSKLYYRLRGSTEGPGSKNMPSGAGALSNEDLDAVKKWILEMP